MDPDPIRIRSYQSSSPICLPSQQPPPPQNLNSNSNFVLDPYASKHRPCCLMTTSCRCLAPPRSRCTPTAPKPVTLKGRSQQCIQCSLPTTEKGDDLTQIPKFFYLASCKIPHRPTTIPSTLASGVPPTLIDSPPSSSTCPKDPTRTGEWSTQSLYGHH